jgi:hypothetical protein
MADAGARPSQALRVWLEAELAGFVDDSSLGNWPQRIAHAAHAVIVEGNGAYFWYLNVDGELFRLDTDDLQQRLALVTDRSEHQQVLRAAAARHPELVADP